MHMHRLIPKKRDGTLAVPSFLLFLQLLGQFLIKLHAAVEIFGAAAGTSAAGTGTGAGTGAAGGTGTMSAAAKAAATAETAAAAATKAAAAGRRFGFGACSYAAGLGSSVPSGGIPQPMPEDIVGAETAGIAVCYQRNADHHIDDDDQNDKERT